MKCKYAIQAGVIDGVKALECHLPFCAYGENYPCGNVKGAPPKICHTIKIEFFLHDPNVENFRKAYSDLMKACDTLLPINVTKDYPFKKEESK